MFNVDILSIPFSGLYLYLTNILNGGLYWCICVTATSTSVKDPSNSTTRENLIFALNFLSFRECLRSGCHLVKPSLKEARRM